MGRIALIAAVRIHAIDEGKTLLAAPGETARPNGGASVARTVSLITSKPLAPIDIGRTIRLGADIASWGATGAPDRTALRNVVAQHPLVPNALFAV